MDDVHGPAWGRRSGFVDLPTPDAAASAAPGRAPVETLHRYAWAYDERAMDVLASVFRDDAIFEGFIAGLGAGGQVGPIRGRDAIVAWLADSMDVQDDQRRHCVLNAITLAESASAAELQAYLVLTAARSGRVQVVTTGFYRVRLARERLTDPWRISHVFAGFDAPY
jgi:hypothetical protein